MRVKVVRTKFEDCPASIAGFGFPETKTHITAAKQYEVYAVSVFRGVVFLQIINDLDMIAWLPGWFFKVVVSSIPADWVCNFWSGEIQMVLGPDFVAADEASYNSMVELAPESVAKFWRRIEATGQSK